MIERSFCMVLLSRANVRLDVGVGRDLAAVLPLRVTGASQHGKTGARESLEDNTEIHGDPYRRVRGTTLPNPARIMGAIFLMELLAAPVMDSLGSLVNIFVPDDSI